MLKDYLINRARKKALAALIREVQAYQVKVSQADSDAFIDLFNTGLMVNLKTAGTRILQLTEKILKKEAGKQKKE